MISRDIQLFDKYNDGLDVWCQENLGQVWKLQVPLRILFSLVVLESSVFPCFSACKPISQSLFVFTKSLTVLLLDQWNHQLCPQIRFLLVGSQSTQRSLGTEVTVIISLQSQPGGKEKSALLTHEKQHHFFKCGLSPTECQILGTETTKRDL